MRSPVPLTLAGMTVLALALGIGRFLLTPLLPLMQADAGLSLVGGGWLASINNIGYLLGALLCTAPALPQRASLRLGLAGVALGTLGMGLAPSLPLWLLCRFVAGVAAALLMVHGIAWCSAHLRAHGRVALEAVLYSGPGIGIIASGALVAALHGAGLDSARWWLAFGAASVAVTALIWRTLDTPAAPAVATAVNSDARGAGPTWPLVAIYGLFGFAYVIPATFLPLIADAQLHLSALREWFWPLYGVATVSATLLLGALPVRSNYAGLAGCCLSMLLGTALCLYWPSRTGLALGTVLEGAAITPVVMYTMREAARLAPRDPTRLIGALTVAFGIGQIVGPPVAAVLAARRHGFAAPLELAALASVLALAIALSRLHRVGALRATRRAAVAGSSCAPSPRSPRTECR